MRILCPRWWKIQLSVDPDPHYTLCFCCSVAESCLTLRPQGLHSPPCPPLSPGLCSDSCALSQWCYLTISSSAAPFSFCLQSFPALYTCYNAIAHAKWHTHRLRDSSEAKHVHMCVRVFATPWTAACQASLFITSSQKLLKLMSIELMIPSNHLILCCPLLLLLSIFPSIRVFSNVSVLCIRWPKYLSFSFSVSASNEYSALISFRIDWLNLLAVQGTLKSLLQHHSSKASILRHSAFFIVQLSHPYMTTGKNHSLN